MAGRYTEAQKRASLNYQKDKAQIKITVTKEQREAYQKLAKSKGLTVTALVKEVLDKAIEDAT
jgi:predicted DNA binding CopG/RHH family protein